MKNSLKFIAPALGAAVIVGYVGVMSLGSKPPPRRHYIDGYIVDNVQFNMSPDGFRLLSGVVSSPGGKNLGTVQLAFNIYGRDGMLAGEVLTPVISAPTSPKSAFTMPVTNRCEGFSFTGAFAP